MWFCSLRCLCSSEKRAHSALLEAPQPSAVTTDYLHDKWGYIESGEWVIPSELDSASPFSEGLARVSRDGKCVYIDRTDTEVLRPESKGTSDCAVIAGDFVDGLARWKIDDQYGYIDKGGRVVISPAFDLTFGFSEGLAAVEIDGLWGYVDSAGRMAIPPRFARAEPFRNGMAEVGLFGGPGRHWGYVNRAGGLIYDSAKSLQVHTQESLRPSPIAPTDDWWRLRTATGL